MLKAIDMIGPKPNLYVNQNKRNKTILGGFLTIICGALFTLAFFAFGIDLYERRRPEISSAKKINMFSTIDSKEINYLLAPMLRGGVEIQEVNRKLDIYMTLTDTDSTRKQEELTIRYTYQMVPCAETELFQKNLNNITQNLVGKPSFYYCLPQSFNRSLLGKFGNPKFQNFDFYVAICKNTTANKNHCYSEEQVTKELESFYVNFIYTDYYMDLLDYEQPFKHFWGSNLLQCSSGSMRSDEYSHKVVNLITESGLILEDKNQKSYFQIDQRSSIVLGKFPLYMTKIKIDISNFNDEYIRKYVKIQTIFANTGGIIKFFMLIFTFLDEYFAEIDFFNELLNKYIKNNNLFRGEKAESSYLPSTSIFIKSQVNQPINITSLSKSKVKQPLETQKINISSENNTLTRPRRINLFNIFCCKAEYSKDKKILSNFKEMIKKKLSIHSIFKTYNRVKDTDKIIFGNTGAPFKNMLVYVNLIDEVYRNKTKLEKTKKSKLRASMGVLQQSRMVDFNKLLYEELLVKE